VAGSFGLRNKLLFLSAVVLLLFVVLNGTAALITSSKLESYLREQSEKEILQKVVDIDRQLNAVLSQKQDLLNLLSENINLAIALKRQRLKVLDELFGDWKNDNEFLGFRLVDSSGTLISGDREAGISLAGESWYQELEKNGVSRIHVEPSGKTPVLWLRSPLTVRNITYFLLGKINWHQLPAFLDQSKLIQLQDNNTFYLILDDRYNLLYLPPFLQKRRQEVATQFATSTSFKPLRNAVRHEEIGCLHQVAFIDQENCVGFARSQNALWLVLSLRNERQTHALINRIYRSNLQVNILVLLAGLGLLSVLIWKIAAPFRQLIAVTGEIVQGKYPDQITIPADDEIRKIVEALNLMMDKVRRQEADVKALYEREKKTSTMLSRANEMLELQSETLQRKNREIRQAFDELRVAQENLLKAERLAVVGETSGRVAHEVLNPVTAILYRVENDLIRCPEMDKSLAGLREIIGEWQRELEQGTLAEYLANKGQGDVAYGEEDLNILLDMTGEFQDLNRKRQQDLEFIFKQIQRVIKIINGLREATMTTRTISRFPVSEPVLESLDLLADSLEKRKITVKKNIPADLPAIDADLTDFIQVFTNLLRNAMQSIDRRQHRDGIISIDIRCRENRAVEVRIKDNGTGIPAAIKGSIFDLHFTTKGEEEGTGLGLGISRKLVRSYGGELLLEESAEGEGATFLVTLQL